MEVQMETLEIQKDLEDEDETEEVNPFHEVGIANQAAQGGLEEWLLHSLDLNGAGIKIEVANFHGKLHAED